MRESFLQFLQRIDEEEFKTFYSNHNIQETANHFNTNPDKITKYCKEIGYQKSMSDILDTQRNTSLSRYGVDNPSKNKQIIDKIKDTRTLNGSYKSVGDKLKEQKEQEFLDLLSGIDKDEFYRLYILENNPREFIMAKYDLSDYMIDKVINYWGFNKDKSNSYKIGIKTKYELYGGKEGYDSYVNNKCKETFIQNSGSIEEHYKKVAEKVNDTFIERYGTRSYYNIEACVKTNQEKYGVDYTCQRPEARLRGNNSKPNKDFAELLSGENIIYEREYAIKNRSYDFRVGADLIEINPTITHNSTFNPYEAKKITPKYYHRDKSKLARDNGFRCIMVWDWDNIDQIKNLLIPMERVYARKCALKEVSQKDAVKFINQYHMQGYAKDNIRLGLYYNDELISIMTFGKPRYNKNYEYELIRYCSCKNVVGGCEKLFSHFIKQYQPHSIISYCDLSKFSGLSYIKLGFTLKDISVGKHWYNLKTKVHITDNLLRQRGFDQLLGKQYGFYGKGTNNEELMLRHGFVTVYDSGQATYVLQL